MAIHPAEQLRLEPTHKQRRDFRLAVQAGIGREALDPKIQVSIDREGYYATIVSSCSAESISDTVVCEDWSLSTGGIVTASLEFMSEGKYLAWSLRRGMPRKLEGGPKEPVASFDEPWDPGTVEKFLNFIHNQQVVSDALTGDPFRFQGVIDKVRGNFVAL